MGDLHLLTVPGGQGPAASLSATPEVAAFGGPGLSLWLCCSPAVALQPALQLSSQDDTAASESRQAECWASSWRVLKPRDAPWVAAEGVSWHLQYLQRPQNFLAQSVLSALQPLDQLRLCCLGQLQFLPNSICQGGGGR